MATSYYKLDIEIRESVGKKSTKAIRRDGKIPSTLYFKGDEPESITIDKIKLYQALKSDQRVYEVELGGESRYVMVKAVQYHPVTDEIIHLDFMRVRRSEKMTISVPLVLVGKPIGVVEGGILSQALNQIEISCFPTDVPEQVELNIEDLELNSAKSVADIEIDVEDLDIVTDPSLNIVSITPPASEEEVVEEVEDVQEGDESLEDASKDEGDDSSDDNSEQSENS